MGHITYDKQIYWSRVEVCGVSEGCHVEVPHPGTSTIDGSAGYNSHGGIASEALVFGHC
ncbi:hypothetical protein PISMIDRAFT_682723 [Pisolithus microcarpus 441]|uniref:Uncharacterized protein n=1 Tax=Pisolithus microcarpus 441 TaxID=765257 RepID=A0A0C9Z118_9AGAM|nr:hypothetical protein PISMIDRAFT_682723 [Pisolithus microcarpus 441]